MRKYQRGVTFIGWVILLAPAAILFYAGIRLAPVYLNYMKLRHTLDSVAAGVSNDAGSADGLLNVINNQFQVDDLDYPSDKDIKIVRENGTWTMEANYEDQAPLFSGISILVNFDKKVKLKGR